MAFLHLYLILTDHYLYYSGKLLYKYCDFTLQYRDYNFTSHFGNKIPLKYCKIKKKLIVYIHCDSSIECRFYTRIRVNTIYHRKN